MQTDEGHSTRGDWRELVAVVLLSVTAIFTAWSGFQASKWGGIMSISFGQASAARVEASRRDAAADQRQAIHVSLFAQWLQAEGAGTVRVRDFVASRFPEPLDSAFRAWLATDPETNPDAPTSPFAMPEYALPERAAALDADRRADERFAEGLEANQRGDNYTLLTVAYASVLFFAGMSAKVRSPRSQWVLVGVAVVFFVAATTLVGTFPKIL